MRRSVRRTLMPLVLAAALGLTACSSQDQPAEFDQGDGTGTAEEGDAAADSDDGDSGSSSVGIDEIDASEVLAEQTYEVPGTDDAATFGVHSLVVEGDIMTLWLTYTPDFGSVEAGDTVNLFDMVDPMKFRPVLVDRQNLKEYLPISDNGQDWSISSLDVEAVNGETAVWWGVYAAPEDDIDTFDLRIFDDMPEFTDVPITR